MKNISFIIWLLIQIFVAINAYTDEFQTIYSKALSLFNDKKYTEAYKLLDKAITQNENIPLQFYVKAFDALNEAFLIGQINEIYLSQETKKYYEILEKREISEERVLESFLYLLANTKDLEKVDETCKKIILQNDKNLTATFFLMKILIQKEKFDLAYNIGMKTIRENQINEINYQLISEIKYMSLISKLYSKNLNNIEEILLTLKGEEIPQLAYLLINTYYTIMMFEKAKEIIEEVGVIDPETAIKTYIALNDKTSLKRILSEYSKEIPDEIKALANSFIANNIGNLKKQIFSQYFKGDPMAMKIKLEILAKEKNEKEIDQALREISYFLFTQGRYKDAIPYLEKIKNQDDFSYYILGSCYMEQREYKKALNTFSKIKKDFKLDAKIREAFLLICLQNYQKANEKLNQSLREIISKGNDTQKILTSQILIELGNLSEATKVLNSCKSKNTTEHNLTLAIILFLKKNYKKAEEILKSILNEDKYNIHGMNALSYLWATTEENLEEALKLTTLTVFFYPDDYTLLDTSAFVHYKIGNYTKAKELILKSIENMEKEGKASYEIYLHAGQIFNALGEKNKAIEMLKKAQNSYTKIHQKKSEEIEKILSKI